jgi:hypothetical protein
MIIDKENEFCDQQAITVSAPSTDYIDLGAAKDAGLGEDLHLCVSVQEDFAAVGAATLTIELQKDDNSGFGSPVSVLKTEAIAKGSLVAGYRRYIPLPAGLDERYVRPYFTVATGPFTAGKVHAAVVKGNPGVKSYDDALDAQASD